MGSINLEATYPHPPERVWAALTDRRAMAEWLMPNDFEPRLGHRFQFRVANAKGWSGIVDCVVTELVPPRHLAYSWKSDKVETHVRWTLEAAGSGHPAPARAQRVQGRGPVPAAQVDHGPRLETDAQQVAARGDRAAAGSPTVTFRRL